MKKIISLLMISLFLLPTVNATRSSDLDIEVIGGEKLTIIIKNNGDEIVDYEYRIKMRGIFTLVSDWGISEIHPGATKESNRWIPTSLMIARGKITTDGGVFRFGGINVFGHLIILYQF